MIPFSLGRMTEHEPFHHDDAVSDTVHAVLMGANMSQLLQHGRFKIYYLIKLYLFPSHELSSPAQNIGIVGSNPTQGAYVCCVYSVCSVLHLGSGLTKRLIPSPRALPTMHRIKKLENWIWPRAINNNNNNKLHGLSPRANYTDRATAACWRSDCQLLRIEGATWSAWRIPTDVLSVFYTGAATFLPSSSSVVLTRLSGPCSKPTTFVSLVVPGIEPKPPDL
jgi:hypothetical protein